MAEYDPLCPLSDNLSADDLSVVNTARVSYGKRSTTFTDKDAHLVNYARQSENCVRQQSAWKGPGMAYYDPLCPLSDNLSAVALVDHMGDDLSVVNAARVSYGKRSTTFTDKDAHLVNYLMTNQHGTPFEHVSFQFRVRAPLFVVHQWERHRIASYNEESGRYIELRGDFYTPGSDRGDILGTHGGDSIMKMRDHWRASFGLYQELRGRGMANELARMVLPVSLYKEFWWTVNARSLMNFLELRADEHAQWEIRQYANSLEYIFGNVCPAIHQAFKDNGRKAP